MNEMNSQEYQAGNITIDESDDREKARVWHCDIYCRKVRHVSCEGQEHIDCNAPDLCPYFDEMLY